MAKEEQFQSAYAFVGEIISTSAQIEIELLYIGLELSESAESVNRMWHRLSAFRSRVDLTDVVVELTNANNQTRKFWLALRGALNELNSLRNHLAHGAVTDNPDEAEARVHVMKIYENRSAKLVPLEDIRAARDLMREGLAVARWFHEFLASFRSEAELEKEFFKVADIRSRARSLKEQQEKLVPSGRLTDHLRQRGDDGREDLAPPSL